MGGVGGVKPYSRRLEEGSSLVEEGLGRGMVAGRAVGVSCNENCVVLEEGGGGHGLGSELGERRE